LCGSNFFSLSLYAVSTKEKTDHLILDATKYQEGIQYVGATKDKVVGYLSQKGTLLIYNIEKDELSEVPFKGFPDSLSPDGNNLLFRNITDNIVDPGFNVLDLSTGSIKKIGMPDNYFYNMVGAWSSNGAKFAFYLNGQEDNEPNKSYRTNVKIGIIDVANGILTSYDKPEQKSNLYTLGSISWIGDNNVIAYTDDNTSWKIKVE
jgi:hypothetical protein